MLLLTGLIAAMMGGGLYAGVQAERPDGPAESATEATPAPEPRQATPPPTAGEEAVSVVEAPTIPDAPFEPVLDVGFQVGEELAPVNDDIVLTSGLRIGRGELFTEPLEEWALDAAEEAEEAAAGEAAARAQRRRQTPRRPPMPRLHPDPGMHSILVARRMMASGERIQGSCYKYLSEVYERAGHRSWRKRRIVYRAERDGPYADLDQIRPGDWLYIVNNPHRTPVGTHSVMFVRWTDRANGYASVISHPGWGAPHTGAERTYDLSRTYRIIRPTL